ncbi:MAG: DUF1801 domain-containing protein [Planctomycetota bacterium]
MGKKSSSKRGPASASKAEPRLLAGGNPQIAKGEGPDAVRAYIDAMPGWKHATGEQIHSAIVRELPGIQMAVKWNTPFYGLPGQGWLVAFHCLTRYIKVTFFAGDQLDPAPPIEAKQPGVRYWHVTEAQDLDAKQLSRWLHQCRELTGWVTGDIA